MTAALDHPARPGQTILRIPAVRWLIAELIPFGCTAAGLLIIRAWPPATILGGFLATFGNFALCVFYLYKVLGTAVGWLLATFPLIVANVGVGAVTIAGTATTVSPQHPDGVKILATTSWWITGACLAVTLAVTVALAVANGERWLRRNRCNLPRNKFEAHARSRGTLAWLWLPRR
jgi:hypothetical protein